jgi:ABC-type sugar transport system substrate-binding protein
MVAILMCALLILGSFAVTAGAETKTYKIAGLMKQNADTFVQKISDAMVARAAELGAEVELLMQDAEGDINKQLEQAEAMKTMGVDAVILNAVDVEGSAPIVDMFIDAGIPVVECNTLTNNSDKATCYVGSDDVDAGKIQAEFLKTVFARRRQGVLHDGPHRRVPADLPQAGHRGEPLQRQQDRSAPGADRQLEARRGPGAGPRTG